MGTKKLKKEKMFFNTEELENPDNQMNDIETLMNDEELDDFYINQRKSYIARNRKYKHFERRRMGDDKFHQRIEHVFVYNGSNN